MAETKVEEDGERSRPRHAASLRRNIASSYLFDQGQSMRDLSTSLEQREHEPDAAALGGPEHEASSRLHQHIRKGECVLRKKLTPTATPSSPSTFVGVILDGDPNELVSALKKAKVTGRGVEMVERKISLLASEDRHDFQRVGFLQVRVGEV